MPGCGLRVRDTAWGVRGVGCGVWGLGRGVRGVGCVLCFAFCVLWGVGCGVWGVTCEVWGVGCGVLGPARLQHVHLAQLHVEGRVDPRAAAALAPGPVKISHLDRTPGCGVASGGFIKEFGFRV
jgi:hypothetical protein